MNRYIESYLDPAFRVTYRDDSEGRNIRAAREKVNEYEAAFKAAAEQKAGRPLSTDEVRHGIKPREDRDARTRQADAAWKPKMSPSDSGKYDAFIAETEKRIDRMNVKTVQTDEARLARLKAYQRWDDEDAHNANAEREWLADPNRAKAIAELDELAATFKYDSSRTESEREAIRKAKLQLSTPGADTSEARRLHRIVFENEANREQNIREAAEADIASAQARLANLKTGKRPKVATPVGSSMPERLHDLFNKVNAAGGTSRDLEVISEARESGDRERQEWVIREYSEQPTGVATEAQ